MEEEDSKKPATLPKSVLTKEKEDTDWSSSDTSSVDSWEEEDYEPGTSGDEEEQRRSGATPPPQPHYRIADEAGGWTETRGFTRTPLPLSLYADGSEPPLDHEAQILDLQRRLAAYMDDLDDMPLEDDDGFFIDLDLVPLRNLQAESNFPQGELVRCECHICFDTVPLRKRLCCDFPICDRCMIQYLETQVNQGIVKIPCMSGICETFVYRDEILGRLSNTMKDRFYKFLVDANKDPKIKTCPRCSHIYKIDEFGSTDHGKYGILVTCPECKIDWCFECHSPWHEQVKCKDYRKGDKLLKMWAREHHYGHNNAQKCPKCKIFIERKGGCDHMVCSQCNTSFCYRCGERFLEVKFFGNHLSRLSPLGCKYNFKPDKPVTRRIIRGSVFSATLLAGIGLLGLGAAAVGVLIGASVIIVPVAVGYKYHKYRKRKKHVKRQQELFRNRTRNALMEFHRERAERAARLPVEGAADTVHIGVQTNQSQQVNVTVHNPYHPDSVAVKDHTLNSEVGVIVKDSKGKVTMTTAEFSQGPAGAAGGSEAEVVLHVKTRYSKPAEAEAEESYEVVFDSVMEKSREESAVANTVIQGKAGAKPVHAPQENSASGHKDGSRSRHGSSSGRHDSSNGRHDSSSGLKDSSSGRKGVSKSSSERSNSLTQHSSKSGKHSASSKTGDSETGRKSEHRRCLHGSLSKNGSLSKKHRKGNSSKTNEAGLQTSLTVPDLGQGDDSFRKTEDTNTDADLGDGQNNESLSQSGCFMKLFSKKLNNLQNQFDKEREKQALTKTLSDGRDKELLDCPDIVSCAVEAELKNADSIRDEQAGPEGRDVEVDRFLEIIAKETCTTQL